MEQIEQIEQSKPKFTARLTVKFLEPWLRQRFKLGPSKGVSKSELLINVSNNCLYLATNMDKEEAQMEWSKLDKENDALLIKRPKGSKRRCRYVKRT